LTRARIRAGIGSPGAELEDGIDQQRHDDGPAVAMQFEHRFTGEGCGTREVQREPLVQALASHIHEHGKRRDPRFR
jgi:hypothetical protein